MHGINVELQGMIKAKRHKASSKRKLPKPPYNFSKTILE
jgi:hypothetical protein